MPSGEDPHEVTCDDHGKIAYITNYGTGRGGYNTLTVADLGAQKPLSTVDLGPLRGPHGIWFAAGKVYFTAEINKAIGRYDPANRKVDWIMGTGQDITHMIKVTPDSTRIFTSNILSGSVSIMESFSIEGVRATRFSPGANDWRVTSLLVGAPSEEYEASTCHPTGVNSGRPVRAATLPWSTPQRKSWFRCSMRKSSALTESSSHRWQICSGFQPC
jgi:hypothetical protein